MTPEKAVEPFGVETIERADCGGPCRQKNVPVVVFAIDPEFRKTDRRFGTGRLCHNCLIDLANEVFEAKL